MTLGREITSSIHFILRIGKRGTVDFVNNNIHEEEDGEDSESEGKMQKSGNPRGRTYTYNRNRFKSESNVFNI